jgi:hypothetical protein
MEIHPWASKDTVARVFEHSQRWMLGKEQRPIGVLALTRLSFAERYFLLAFPRKPSWKEVAAAWDVEQKSRSGRRQEATEWREFQRDVARTRRSLLRPIYAMGESLSRLTRAEEIRRALAKMSLDSQTPRAERLHAELSNLMRIPKRAGKSRTLRPDRR